LTTVETNSFSGNMWPQLRAVYPRQEIIERSSMNSWDDRNFVAAIEKTLMGVQTGRGLRNLPFKIRNRSLMLYARRGRGREVEPTSRPAPVEN
jgi:hypothetical protein